MKKQSPSMDAWLQEAKAHESAPKIGMYLTHNGVVRQTAKAMVRNGAENTQAVTGLLETLGRAYEMRDTRTIDERIRDLMHERDITAKAIAEQNQRKAFDAIAQSGKGFGRTPEDLRSHYVSSMQGYYSKPDMTGYQPYQPVPTVNPTVDDYEQAMADYYRRKI